MRAVTLTTLRLEVAGVGMVIYSPFAMANVPRGARFLDESYGEPAEVARHVCAGTLAGFCTGSGGTFDVELLAGGLTIELAARCRWWIRLALEVRDHTACLRDLYDLACWTPECPPAQTFSIPDGFYRLSVGTRPSESGLVGDDQLVVVCFERVDALPVLGWEGVPFLGDDPDEDDD